ncbi:MAG TPA: E2/UBC family protein [Gemmatimonas sp.]|nr:E2/UBC family protein [Gemmatimonas sp.]
MSSSSERSGTVAPAFGAAHLHAELEELGYAVTMVEAAQQSFVVITAYVVPAGQFADRVIDLGLPAPPDFPNTVGAAIHVRATPQLHARGHVKDVRNVIDSPLGPEWCYWSHRIPWAGERAGAAARLLAHVASIFERA